MVVNDTVPVTRTLTKEMRSMPQAAEISATYTGTVGAAHHKTGCHGRILFVQRPPALRILNTQLA